MTQTVNNLPLTALDVVRWVKTLPDDFEFLHWTPTMKLASAWRRSVYGACCLIGEYANQHTHRIFVDPHLKIANFQDGYYLLFSVDGDIRTREAIEDIQVSALVRAFDLLVGAYEFSVPNAYDGHLTAAQVRTHLAPIFARVEQGIPLTMEFMEQVINEQFPRTTPPAEEEDQTDANL